MEGFRCRLFAFHMWLVKSTAGGVCHVGNKYETTMRHHCSYKQMLGVTEQLPK